MFVDLIYVCPWWGKTNDWKILGSSLVRSTRSRNVLSMESTISCAQNYDNQIHHRQQPINTCSYIVELEKNQTSKLFSARRRTRSLPFNLSHELKFLDSLLYHPPFFSLSFLLVLKRWQKIKITLGSNSGSRTFLQRWTVKDSKTYGRHIFWNGKWTTKTHVNEDIHFISFPSCIKNTLL